MNNRASLSFLDLQYILTGKLVINVAARKVFLIFRHDPKWDETSRITSLHYHLTQTNKPTVMAMEETSKISSWSDITLTVLHVVLY